MLSVLWLVHRTHGAYSAPVSVLHRCFLLHRAVHRTQTVTCALSAHVDGVVTAVPELQLKSLLNGGNKMLVSARIILVSVIKSHTMLANVKLLTAKRPDLLTTIRKSLVIRERRREQ